MTCGTCRIPVRTEPRLRTQIRRGEQRRVPTVDSEGRIVQGNGDSAGIIKAIRELSSLIAPPDSLILSFNKSIPPATADAQKRRIPFPVFIVAVFISFPPGTNQLVDVRLTASVRGTLDYIIPSHDNSFISLDSSLIPYLNLRIPMQEGTELQAEWFNYDGVNPHTVPISIVIANVGRVGGVRLPFTMFTPLPKAIAAPTPSPVAARIIPSPVAPSAPAPPRLPPVKEIEQVIPVPGVGEILQVKPQLTIRTPTVEPRNVKPGETVFITVPLLLQGIASKVVDVKIAVIGPSGLSESGVAVSVPLLRDEISVGTVPIEVPSTATPGLYSVRVSVGKASRLFKNLFRVERLVELIPPIVTPPPISVPAIAVPRREKGFVKLESVTAIPETIESGDPVTLNFTISGDVDKELFLIVNSVTAPTRIVTFRVSGGKSIIVPVTLQTRDNLGRKLYGLNAQVRGADENIGYARKSFRNVIRVRRV